MLLILPVFEHKPRPFEQKWPLNQGVASPGWTEVSPTNIPVEDTFLSVPARISQTPL